MADRVRKTVTEPGVAANDAHERLHGKPLGAYIAAAVLSLAATILIVITPGLATQSEATSAPTTLLKAATSLRGLWLTGPAYVTVLALVVRWRFATAACLLALAIYISITAATWGLFFTPALAALLFAWRMDRPDPD